MKTAGKIYAAAAAIAVYLACAPLQAQQETDHLPTEPYSRVISPSTPDEIGLAYCGWVAGKAMGTFTKLATNDLSAADLSVAAPRLAEVSIRISHHACAAGDLVAVSAIRRPADDDPGHNSAVGVSLPDECLDEAREAPKLLRSVIAAGLEAEVKLRWGRLTAVDTEPDCGPRNTLAGTDVIVWLFPCVNRLEPDEVLLPLVRESVRCRG